MGAILFDHAVDLLDQYMQKKSVHAVKDVKATMSAICAYTWFKRDEQQEFAQICANFDVYTRTNDLRSMGRKQFETWWELHAMAGEIDLPEDPLPDFGITEAVDILQEHFEAADNSPEGYDLRKENQELRKRNQELLARLNKAEQTLAKIREAVLWGSSN